MALLVVILVYTIGLFVRSTKEPVNIFGLYTINNFEVVKN